MTRGLLRNIARALIGVMLFTQLAIAAYACPKHLQAAAQGTAANVVGAPDAGDATQPASPCEEMAGMPATALDSTSPNLCAEHCRYGQQSGQTSTIDVPVPFLTALYCMPPIHDTAALSRAAAASSRAVVAASPPASIRHCRLLI